MDAVEAIAVIVLIIAVVILIYYYFLNSPQNINKIKRYVPPSADAHMDQVLSTNTETDGLNKEKESMSKRIKVKLSDIDMSSLNTDAFSNKIDAFLDAKSEELIKDWSLATTDDLEDLQAKFSQTTTNVDNLEKDFNEFKKSSEEFQKSTEEKLNDLDKRIESLENN